MRKILLFLFIPSLAHAFCGFYVSGSGQKLTNNATVVVMMRGGARTVLSMQNNYQGPPESFAMVVPVPVVLQKENVKTLPREIFERVESLAAPRLVEYWEQDPCQPPVVYDMAPTGGAVPMPSRMERDDHGVKIEAQFTVGEYEVVVLSASDSQGLDTWLHQNGYKIPDGAEPYLRPYVQAGSKFFVAKVDVTKVQMKDGQAMLSPLRFHYDTDAFTLPIRLGLINSNGNQDLIVHILGAARYEVANYDNVQIPTNIDVSDEVRQDFAAFYAELFDATVAKHPKAIVTEYAWAPTSCDPCPVDPLSPSEIATLGGDVIPQQSAGPLVLTRLHTRYSKESLGEDLTFKEAPAISGGREFSSGGGTNDFQARYIIRHPWTKPITCKDPVRGRWGGPPNGGEQPQTTTAPQTAFARRGAVPLATAIRDEKLVKELGLAAAPTPAPTPTSQPSKSPPTDRPIPHEPGVKHSCGCVVGGQSPPGAPLLLVLVLCVAWRSRHSS